MKRLFILWFFLATAILVKSQQQEVPFTLADRNRLIQTENKLDSLINKIDRFENGSLARIDRFEHDVLTRFKWGVGLVLGAIFALFILIIYDRRSIMSLVRRHRKMLAAMSEIGKEDTNIREALKKVALW